MPTRPSSSAIDILQDAKQLVARAKKELPALLKADKARGKTAGTNMADVKALDADIAAYQTANAAQRGKATTAKSSTATEVNARKALSAELQSIRADVTDAAPSDIALQKAFGRGLSVTSSVTKTLLSAADQIVGAFATRAKDVKSAGVTKARVDKLKRLRAALADADVAQRGALGDRSGATGASTALLARIKAGTAKLRRRLGRAPEGKATVKSTSARRAVKKRTPKPAPVPLAAPAS